MDIRPRTQVLPAPRAETRPLGDLVFRHDLQVRAIPKVSGVIATDDATVQRYLTLYREGTDLGALVVVDTPETTGLVADGNHRGAALRLLHGAEWRAALVPVLAYAGSEHDARMLACELNANRGLQFSGGDLARVAEIYLRALFDQGVNPTDASIARILGVSRPTVMTARARLEAFYPELNPARVGARRDAQGEPVPMRLPERRGTVLDRDDDAAYRAAPAGPPPRMAAPARYQAPAGNGHRAAPDVRGTLIGQYAQHQRALLDPPEDLPYPVVQPGDPIALVLRWTMVSADGEPLDGTAQTATDFAGLPGAVRARLLQLLEA